MQALEFLNIFISPFEDKKLSYFITGSIASIYYGEPRLTHDIDIVMYLKAEEIDEFSSLFDLENFYCPPAEVLRIESKRKPYGHFNLIHHESGFKADIYPDAGDKLHAWAFQNRKRVSIHNDLSIWLAPPEYVVLRKLEFFREGASEKHLEDIRKMLIQIGEDLDRDFLEKEIDERGLRSHWQKL